MRCVLGLAMLRDRKKWRVSGLAAVPQGKTRRKTGSTLLRDGETRRKTRRVGPIGRGKGTHKGGERPYECSSTSTKARKQVADVTGVRLR